MEGEMTEFQKKEIEAQRLFELSETQDKLLEKAIFYLSHKVKLLHHFIMQSGLIYELNRFENL
jgi:hypothetical protein